MNVQMNMDGYIHRIVIHVLELTEMLHWDFQTTMYHQLGVFHLV